MLPARRMARCSACRCFRVDRATLPEPRAPASGAAKARRSVRPFRRPEALLTRHPSRRALVHLLQEGVHRLAEAGEVLVDVTPDPVAADLDVGVDDDVAQADELGEIVD